MCLNQYPNHTNNNAPKVTANKKATCHRWSGWGVCIDPPTKPPAATCYNKSRDGFWDRVGREKGLPPCKETPPPVDRIHKYTQKCVKEKWEVSSDGGRVRCLEYEVNKNWNRMAECMSGKRWQESGEELKRRCETECKGPLEKRPARCTWDPKAKSDFASGSSSWM